jgi:hypothetical protein
LNPDKSVKFNLAKLSKKGSDTYQAAMLASNPAMNLHQSLHIAEKMTKISKTSIQLGNFNSLMEE